MMYPEEPLLVGAAEGIWKGSDARVNIGIFLLRKDIDGNVYVVTIQRGKRKLQIKTMWKENRSGASC